MRKALRRATCALALFALAANSNAAFAHDADEILDLPLTPPPPPRRSPPVSASLDAVDATAALDGIRIALSEVADGGSYVWHRRDGVLSGMAQPKSSFKDQTGLPCRNLTVMLNTYGRSSRIDGVACRNADGRWHLTG